MAETKIQLIEDDATVFKDMNEIFGLLENAPTNIMYCDRDLTIKYVNPASKKTLKSLESLLPVKIDQIEGSSIDIFHKNPAHQRRLLSDDSKLPLQSNIELGPEILNFGASAIYDRSKKFVGVMVVWDIITEKLKTETEMARISSMMENAPINVMYCGTDFKIAYINPKSKETLKQLEKFLPVTIDKVLGSSVDIFHKNPEHQRRLLADDRNLPKRSKIKVGDQTLDLLASPIYDANKKYLGAMVTWDIITARVNLVSTLEVTANQLASAAEQLSATATQLTQNSEKTSKESTLAAAAAEQVAKGVSTVAVNSEEMAASIKEIASSSSKGAIMSKESMTKVQETHVTINKLGDSSKEIGDVIKVISSIAQQTNLLALNATIEAARAGDAGKGFAVVANEVKELAKQTAKATEDITNKIATIQGDTQGAVNSMGGISKAIEALNGISMSIAAAVEEQSATTNEVTRVTQESSKAVEGIAATAKSVLEAATQSAAGAGQTLDAAKSLTQLAEKLKELVKQIGV